MNLARSTFYSPPMGQRPKDAQIIEKIAEICVEYPRYGYRRVTAQLRREGFLVNHKKALRIMREQGLSVQPRRRYVVTTDSNHDGPIFPNLATDVVPSGPNQLWVADLTYIAIARGFAYLAVILDAWSRRVVGYAVASFMDVRLTVAAPRSAIDSRLPPSGCIHHSDRGSQYAAEPYRELLAAFEKIPSFVVQGIALQTFEKCGILLCREFRSGTKSMKFPVFRPASGNSDGETSSR